MKKLWWLCSASLIALLTGCSETPEPTTPTRDATTTDVIAAFTISRQQSGVVESDGKGYVVLVKEDGGTSVIETTIMQHAQLDWNKDKLAFSDTENDYIVGTSTEVIPTDTKTDYQQALSLSDDGTVIGLYNDGYEEDSYVEQLITSSTKGSDFTEVEGYFQVTGFCDGDLYGIAEPLGKYQAEAERQGVEAKEADGYTRLMLNQLTSGTTVEEENVSIQAVNSSGQESTDAPCVDGSLYHLASIYADSGETTPVLRIWDTDSGDMTELELVTADGEPVTGPDQSTFEINGSSQQSLRGNDFDWVDDFGRAWRTDITTGISQKLFELVDSYDNSTDTRVVDFTENALTVVTFQQEAEEVRLVQYDRNSGEVLTEIDLPDIAKTIDDSSIWAVSARD
ncbi:MULTISPECIES: hypothetical protein [Brevibacterium]|uniref:Lipoprotein n=7 Tax=Brevibacterium TaxID=1696 RepID=A0A2H1KNU6_BRELN|nr:MULTISPECIES: hypothetical protein [Brevibacterium]SMY02312.1 hypothetical protein BANT10_03371 [Brevibacterium antiquum]SMY04869.1 hypothetical protein BSP239C_03996 [Brevibacterium sp. 239c]AZT92773.1 hypothetical protein CXR23_06170 [Brevibacterium aurantiacum]AZT96599.1 hypothetical protein CXR27_05970 [Brevibacterium aurantiacum]KAB1941894.1 hypothetical protein F8227_17510 [Brevibacterium linens ATCC 9172]